MNKNILYFHHACVVNDVETIEKMIKFEEDLDINSADADGDTPLHKAVLFKNYEIAKYLLDAGCLKKKKNSYGWTALDMAIVNRDSLIAKLLVEYASDDYIVDVEWLYDVLYKD
jgi:ankyrin repeat protein